MSSFQRRYRTEKGFEAEQEKMLKIGFRVIHVARDYRGILATYNSVNAPIVSPDLLTRPHIPQWSRFGGRVLAVMLIACVLCWWFAIIDALGGHGSPDSAPPAFIVLVLGAWTLLALDNPGFVSFNDRISWNVLSRGKKFWLVCGFLFVPEIMVTVYLSFALQDYMHAHTITVRQQGSALWARLRGASRNRQIAVASGAVIGLVLFGLLTSASYAHGQAAYSAYIAATNSGQIATTSGNSNGTVAQIAAPTATEVPSPTATSIPPTPTPAPTDTPVPPAPANTGVDGNPWGYNFTPGNLIYSPPSNFCDYFACIKSFWSSTSGYVEECQDGDFSHSGGRSGSCSYHGGDMRPLYSH